MTTIKLNSIKKSILFSISIVCFTACSSPSHGPSAPEQYPASDASSKLPDSAGKTLKNTDTSAKKTDTTITVNGKTKNVQPGTNGGSTNLGTGKDKSHVPKEVNR